ncbi:MAG: permease prefix domain 2-containing transporter [Bacteroidota bacterium]
MKKQEHEPPRIAMTLFRWFCQPEFREEIEGDLLERYDKNAQQDGFKRANRRFQKDVILLFRPSIVRNPFRSQHTDQPLGRKQGKRFAIIMGLTTAILLIPLVMMKFTKEVNWHALDFLVAGALLFGAGLSIDFVLRKISSRPKKALLVPAILLTLIFVWAELAIGIVESLIAAN